MPSTLLADAPEAMDAVAVQHEEVVEHEEADAAVAAAAVAVEHEAVVVVKVVEDNSHAITMILGAMVCLEANSAPLASPLA